MTAPLLIGVDFSSRPSLRKPVTLATGQLRGHALQLGAALRFDNLPALADWLARPGPWVGGFDLPDEFEDDDGRGLSELPLAHGDDGRA